MLQGVPQSLMGVNITSAYADAFCKSFAPSNLTLQQWPDGPICQRANITLKVCCTVSVPPCSEPCIASNVMRAQLASANQCMSAAPPLLKACRADCLDALSAQAVHFSLLRAFLLLAPCSDRSQCSSASYIWECHDVHEKSPCHVLQAGQHQPDACGAVVNVPKVAMLFLATKGFPHAPMWSMWFQQVRGLVPKDCVAQALCPGGGTRGDVAGFNDLVQACGPTKETLGEAMV